MDEIEIYLIGGEDDEPGVLLMDEREGECWLKFKYRTREIEASSTDYFEAFCQIRIELEKENLLPFCYGASLNVYPSGMARDMGGGLRAYKLISGKPAKMTDLVDIFSEGPDVIPAYVSRQKEFFEDWLNAPKA